VFCLSDVPEGRISPFDTGGLVNHHRPVCEWRLDPTKRTHYLRAFSFDSSALAENLSKYPGESQPTYLRGERPTADGPHEVWTQGPEANLWSDEANDWRAWAWEWRGRTLPVADRLVAWSCSMNVRAQLSEQALAPELWNKFCEPEKLPMKAKVRK
jgi:hypothetical protein